MSEPNPTTWQCAAGRTAFYGGLWREPCELPTEHQHVIIAANARVELCDTHFAEAHADGLVSDPYVSRDVAEHMAEEERRRLEKGKGRL